MAQGAYEDHEYVYMVMELCSGGDLYQRIDAAKGKQLPEAQVAAIVSQVRAVPSDSQVVSCSSERQGGPSDSSARRTAMSKLRIGRMGIRQMSSRPPISLSGIVALVPRATRTPQKFGRCPSFKSHFLSPRAEP
jgi:serine/threonine protein kinase